MSMVFQMSANLARFWAVIGLLLLPLTAQAFEPNARAIWVYDLTSDTVLLEKDADVPLPPASMSKLMTLNMLFEALDDGRVQLDTQFSVSQKAMELGGSTMFLNTTDRPTVEDLIKGIIVVSGNDACIVVAEGLAGTETAFAAAMTQRAQALGMTGSTFANASGWPAPGHRMAMEDLGILAVRLIEDFPQFYDYFALEEFPFDGRAPDNRFNRNPLLKLGVGADGLKTGHTQEAGYGLVGSAKQGDRRIVFAFTGLESSAARAQEAERVVNWAFRQFVSKEIATQGQEFATAEVWMGREASVGLVAAEDTSVLLPALQRLEDVNARVVVADPIPAPITVGDALAELVIEREGLEEARIPLVADRSVERGGLVARVKTAIKILSGSMLGG